MVPCTLLRWRRTEVSTTRATRQARHTARATVTLSVLTTSSGSTERQTARTGPAATTTSMPASATTEHVASSSTSGKPTVRAAPTPTIRVMYKASTGARESSVETTSRTTGLTGSATRTAVTTTTGDRGTRLTSDLALTSRWTPPGP